MVQLLGNLFILSAPSGAGKSSLIKALLEKHCGSDPLASKSMRVSVSHTTRKPRPGEVDGEHYHFVDREAFEQLIQEGAFFEWAEVFDNYYGTSRLAIEDTLSRGVDVFLDIDWQGARQVKALMPDAVGIFILPPSISVLRDRLDSRGQDSDEVIQARMQKAKDEMSHFNEFDYMLINDDFETALVGLENIVFAQREKVSNQRLRHSDLISDLLE
ncbi:guanylate kinase [Alteromonas oceanisediminis]|uniref:guanylate kinase n=1 Tax=Alteromonas oceanisediminis TaxID=2836180 RepID=UPI001BD9F6CD|nr:guanylate kinase [Alteromonas oceanisediminis]MBT0586801.1 guanylate kinase [Alteromonas oceanisediminis]